MTLDKIFNKIFTNFKNCDPYGKVKSGPFEDYKDCENENCPFHISENDSGCYPTCLLPHFVEKTLQLKIESHQSDEQQEEPDVR